MQTIAEYQRSREQAAAVEIKAIPEVRPFARKHVEKLQEDGKSVLVLRQLVREAESSRRVSTEEALAEHAEALNVPALQAGLDAFRAALETGKRTARKVSKIEHKGGKYNPINALSVDAQAEATWDAVVSFVGRMADADRPLSVQTLAGHLGKRLRGLAHGAAEYGDFGYERAALVLLDHFCAATGWLEENRAVPKAFMGGIRKNPNTYTLTPKFMEDALGGGVAVDFSERRPMLVRPVPWTTTATHGGYLHSPVQAVRGTPNPIGSPVIVAALNALQETAFRVNREVLAVARTFNTNAEDVGGSMVLGRYMEARHDVAEHVQRAKTIRSALTLSAIAELEYVEEFFFPWNLDWRARMYPATSLVSPQGADLCKGLLQFADGTPLGREGGKWLAIHLCNLAGADKAIVGGSYQTRTPEEREAWTLERSAEILAVAADPLANRSWHLAGGFGLQKVKRGRVVPVAVDKPWQFLAACFEWASFQAEGPGFRSRLAGALDGSCSGVQMLAGMTRDRSAGTMVNLVPAPRGDDYYGRMAGALSERLYKLVDSADAGDMEHLRYWSEQTLDRDLLKAPSMTKVYSAGTYTFGEQVQAKTGAPDGEAMWLAAQINECFGDVAPGMLRAMSYLQAVSDVLTEEGVALHWKTPAGLGVQQARHETGSVRLDTQVAGPETRKTRTFVFNRDGLSKKAQRAGVSPNFVHGVDSSHMAMSVNALHAQGVRNFWMIHDSFGAPFAQCQAVFDTTREQFIELMSGDLLRQWTDDVTALLSPEGKAKLPSLPEYGELDLNEVRDSVYAWF
jgi:DNA-directed RNA polymerase